VVSASGNDAFNSGLIAYLKQLQKIGFGPHKGNRPYELDVEFIANE
jgi:protein TonB